MLTRSTLNHSRGRPCASFKSGPSTKRRFDDGGSNKKKGRCYPPSPLAPQQAARRGPYHACCCVNHCSSDLNCITSTHAARDVSNIRSCKRHFYCLIVPLSSLDGVEGRPKKSTFAAFPYLLVRATGKSFSGTLSKSPSGCSSAFLRWISLCRCSTSNTSITCIQNNKQ